MTPLVAPIEACLRRLSDRRIAAGFPLFDPGACADGITIRIRGADGGFARDYLADLWHHAGRPVLPDLSPVDAEYRRQTLIARGLTSLWRLHEAIVLGEPIDAYHLTAIITAAGASTLALPTTTRRLAIQALVSTLPTR